MMNINQTELPDIYICPDGQFKMENLKRNGYATRNMLLAGGPRVELSRPMSWGDHLNMTFEEMMKDILPNVTKRSDENARIMGMSIRQVKTLFVPRYGFCMQIRNYTTSKEFTIIAHNSSAEIHIFILDKAKHTYATPDFESHSGDFIVLEQGVEKWFDVKLSLNSFEDPTNDDACQHYDATDSYAMCVDSKIQDVMLPGIKIKF
jgi:hypothetical protein